MTQEFDAPTLYCVNHPDTPTSLRCNRCERPICTRCAVLTPTGYRCKDCVRGQQKTFETSQTTDYVFAIVIGAGLSYLGSLVARSMGFFIIFLAPVIGVIIAEAIRWAVKKRRSRLLFQLAAGAAAAGSLLPVILTLLAVLAFLASGRGLNFMGFLPLIYQLVYTFLVTSTVYTRLSGIQLRR
jgi:hypothetical protein